MLDHIMQNKIAEVVLCICRQDDSTKESIFPSLMKRSKELDIPVLQPKKINSHRVFSCVEKLNPDIVLSLQNNMIFGEEWINFFENRLGIANIHYSPLPRYAGYWPEMWAIWNSESDFAVTLHYVSIGVDTGPIIAQRYFKISELETRKSLYDKSTLECFKMLKDNISSLIEEKQPTIDQNKSLRTYFPKALPNDGILDLNWDFETQLRFIRAIAFPGFPGPKIRIGDNMYTILKEDLPFFKRIGTSVIE